MSAQLSREDISREVDLMVWSANMSMIRRCFDMSYWETESQEEHSADMLRTGPRLESVADHSWHICDCILLIGPHFAVNIHKCLMLAILHDKLELFTGDMSPMGPSGTGLDGTAYNQALAKAKRQAELEALNIYLNMLPRHTKQYQQELMLEYINEASSEARFVKAVDRLQVYTWLIRSKGGKLSNKHLLFNLRYLRSGVSHFPPLLNYCYEFEERLLDLVALERGIFRPYLDVYIDLDTVRSSTSPPPATLQPTSRMQRQLASILNSR